ncbi:MAG: carboxypeptidase regulatory-like domain-containing protein [Flavobacteriales bacterium]|nr:carboxypeptidase regulatory-like domain-containing protein [Flavobacteriales bacterium]
MISFKNVLVLILMCAPFFLKSQITSSSIEGSVHDSLGNKLQYATIQVTHIPTGTFFGATSMKDGHFVLDNLKPGGPYKLVASIVGYRKLIKENIYVDLGKTHWFDLKMKEDVHMLGPVSILGDRNDVFNNDKKGISNNIDERTINSTPSLNRSLQDVTRLSPQGGQSSFAGANYRYNNLSIDGASNNDVLGFQEPSSGAAGSLASGTPGALAGTQPISLDAIQELQVSIAPYDVKQGNFTGASINAVTRGGTNTLEGSAYFFGRNQWITGKSANEERSAIADYYDYQSGFRLGGPLIKNKLFVFANYENTGRKEPILNEPGTEGTQISREIAQAISDTLISRYDYDPGSFGALFNERKSDKFFIRLDYNINKKHQLILRDNYVVGSADNLDRGSNFLKFSSQAFTHISKTNSLVAELKSRFNGRVFNHLIVGYNTVNDERVYDGDVFPHVEITHNSANTIFLGTYREASIYGLTLNTTQISDNLKIYKNKHTITVGTNNDIYDIQYRFLTAWNGRWEYKSLDHFFNDQPKRIRGVYNYGDNSFEYNKNNPSADFRVMLLSFYTQDRYRFSNRFEVTAGVRLDLQVHPDKVPKNEAVFNTTAFQGYHNDFGGTPQVNPRLGFQLALNENKTMQLRGGSGLFTGRIPFAWYAYAHYISGLNYGNIDLRPDSNLTITPDLANLQVLQPNLTEINLIDDDFKLPRDWRSSISFDWKLNKGLNLTFEGMFSKSIQDIWFRSINLKDSTTIMEGADDRLVYLGSGEDKKINPAFTNVFLLTNTNKGYKYFLTVQANKKFDNGLMVTSAYTFGESKDLMNGVRNSMAANFSWNQSVNSNDPDLSWSNFDIRHKIVGTAQYKFKLNPRNQTMVTLVYTGRSGAPFSYTVAGDLNNDGSSKNDLFYVPANKNEIQLVDIVDNNGDVVISTEEQWEQLNKYISADDYLSSRRGQHTERNGGRAPWNNLLDLRVAHQLFPKESKPNNFEFTFDIINILNLLHYSWGLQSYVPNLQNSSYQLIDLEGTENNQATYQFNNPNGTPWQIDQLNSRWQAQLGLRYNF